MQKPNSHRGLRHVALYCKNLESCVHFYTELLGLKVVWQPDADNYYLSSGDDNFALHRAPADFAPAQHQHLDHIGFFLAQREDVDTWHDFLRAHDIVIKAAPKDHRDGTRSFYCADPDGNVVQMIWISGIKTTLDEAHQFRAKTANVNLIQTQLDDAKNKDRK